MKPSQPQRKSCDQKFHFFCFLGFEPSRFCSVRFGTRFTFGAPRFLPLPLPAGWATALRGRRVLPSQGCLGFRVWGLEFRVYIG